MRLLRSRIMNRPALTRLAPSLGPGLLMLAIALVGAGHPVLSWDEIATADVAGRTSGQIWRLIQHVDGVFGPYYYLEHVWTHLAGSSELSLRMPSILAMSGAAALTGELGRRLYGPLTGALAGLLFDLIPNTSRYAAEARPYAFACFFALLALILLHVAVARPGRARWTAYGISVLFLGLAHVIALTTLAAHAVVLWRRGSRRTVAGWAAAAVPALLALAPIFWLGVHERGAQLSWVPPLTTGGLWKFPEQVVGSVAGGWLLLGLAALALCRPLPVRSPAAPDSAAPDSAQPDAARIELTARAEIAALALGPIVAVAAVSELVAPYWVARYLLVVLAPLALLAAAGLRDVLALRFTPRALARLAVVVAVLACAVYPAQHAVRTAGAKNGSDYRTAAALIWKNQRADDGIAYTANSRTMRTGLSYYLRHDAARPRDLLLARTATQDAALRATEFAPTPARLAGTARLWLLVYGVHKDPLTVRPDLRTVLAGRYRRTRIWFLHRETLALFVRVAPATEIHSP
jgi:mannosyltransferase